MQAGDKLGHFEIREKIGAGGMGEVFLAEDLRLGRRVAIKILPAEVAADPGRRSRFAREARAASALSHPNIAHIYDVGEQDGTHFIAMEYVEGADLSEKLSESSLEQDEILDIAVQVADALEEARGKGIVHRDIKPANIALTGRGEVKVLDFGLAKLMQPLESESGDHTASLSQTAEGAVLGTAHYMSPEQAQGSKIDTRSDLFSLGTVLYEMVAGRKAFDSDGLLGIIHAITHREPEALARFNYEVSPELERIILKCLEKEPDHRYQTPRGLLVDLRSLQRTNQSGTMTSSQIDLGGKPPRRRGLLAGILASVAVAAVAAVYFLAPRAGAEIDSLVVIPFENTTGDEEVEYLCDGVTESLINTLAQVPDLKVISRISAFSLKGQEIDHAAVGSRLNVDALLFGRVVRHGDDLDISTELVAAKDSRQLWGERYTRPVGEVQSISNDITGTIAKTLQLELAGGDELLERRSAANPEAYRLYLKGMYFTTGTRREMDSAIDSFQQAIALDQDFALAWAGLAHTYSRQLFLRGSEREPTFGLATEAARKAMELDPDLPEASTASGLIKMYFNWDWAGAEADLRRGYERSDGTVPPVMTYGDFCIFTTNYDKAVELHSRAEELDPLSHVTAHDLGFTYMAMKEYDKAAAQFKRALDLNPNWVWGHIKLGKTYAHMGRCTEALESAAVAEDLLAGSGTPSTRSWLDYTYALCGETAKARAGLADLESREEYVDPSLLAIIQIGLGDNEGAIANFEKSFEDQSTNMVFLKMTPDIYPGDYAEDPRFKDLVRRVGFP